MDEQTNKKGGFWALSRFTIRDLLMVMLLSAALMGWLTATRSVEKYKQRWEAAEYKYLDRVQLIEGMVERMYASRVPESKNKRSNRRLLSGSNFNGSNLQGITLSTQKPVMQSASLERANLENANISGGTSSFQNVSFENAKLRGAQLSGRGSSFQNANFAGADLTNATLSSAGASFQGCTFRGATMNGAIIKCGGGSDFQVNDITNADFSNADLTDIPADSLKRSYFADPPVYSDGTKFPVDFDAKGLGWKHVSEKVELSAP